MKHLVISCVLLVLLQNASFAAGAAGGPPPGKKWKLVFSDEFDGPALDASKWTRRANSPAFVWNGAKGRLREDHADVDGQGHFVIKVTRDPDGTYNYHNGVETKGKFEKTFGYFETRAKFTRQPGWWGAVWLYGVEVGPNPFIMGQEIDIFEDFNKPKKKLDFSHNVHFDAQLSFANENNRRVGKIDGNVLYRVSRGQQVMVGDWNAYHVVGVEWTPLEYVFYCDGRETFRLDYKEVPVTDQPMHVLISGCFREPRKASFMGDYADATWPDQLTVDYVRVYEEDLGARQRPKVTLKMSTPAALVESDKDVVVQVSASQSGSVLSQVLLFDNGRLRGEKPGASASFTIPSNQLYAGENVLIAMARDSKGLVGMSQPLHFRANEPPGKPSTPYEGKPQAVPGHIIPGHYDEGGRGVAYGSYLKDNDLSRSQYKITFRTAEGITSPGPKGIGASHRDQWVKYTLDVKGAGDYQVTPLIARPDAMRGGSKRPDRIILELDDKPLTEFQFSSTFTTGKNYWGDYKPLPPQTVSLPAGTHVLRVRFDAAPFNFGGLNFAQP